MRTFLTTVILLITILTAATAQQGGDSYIVYSVAGNVKTAGHPIQPKQKLFPLQTVTMGKESQLTLLNEDAKLLYSLSRTGTWTVKEYIRDMQPSVLRLSANYLRYIKDQLFSNTGDTGQNRKLGKVTTTGYRGEEENQQFIQAMCACLQVSDHETLQEAFIHKDPSLGSNYLLTFELVSHWDGSVLKPDGSNLKNPYYVRVTNHSLITLFVNILNIDNSLNTYLVLQPDDQGHFANYLIPAGSTVAFPQQTIEFGGSSTENFVLMAAPFPVDFSLLESPIRKSGENKSKLKIGLSRLTFKLQ